MRLRPVSFWSSLICRNVAGRHAGMRAGMLWNVAGMDAGMRAGMLLLAGHRNSSTFGTAVAAVPAIEEAATDEAVEPAVVEAAPSLVASKRD